MSKKLVNRSFNPGLRSRTENSANWRLNGARAQKQEVHPVASIYLCRWMDFFFTPFYLCTHGGFRSANLCLRSYVNHGLMLVSKLLDAPLFKGSVFFRI
jgi:hypothetical protein